jgi:hypothetical protein
MPLFMASLFLWVYFMYRNHHHHDGYFSIGLWSIDLLSASCFNMNRILYSLALMCRAVLLRKCLSQFVSKSCVGAIFHLGGSTNTDLTLNLMLCRMHIGVKSCGPEVEMFVT